MNQRTHLVEPSSEVDDLARRTIGAAIEVHRVLGPGFLEAVYEEALCAEFAARGLQFGRQVPVSIAYKSRVVGQARLDLVVADQLIVELKAVPVLLPVHIAQVASYLRALQKPLGLLINFEVRILRMGIRRVVRGQ
ncbi:MAG TPA: GxxExxY protein [Polyangia bacterium]|nr:GxxExxY protein [Polyangia bacterium]